MDFTEQAKTVATIIGLASGFLTVLTGLFFWSFKWLLDRYHDRMDQRFTALEEKEDARFSAIAKLERELMELRAELPQKYVQREDWIRFGSMIDAKLDTLRALFEQLKDKVATR
jgi:hypothetical protein